MPAPQIEMELEEQFFPTTAARFRRLLPWLGLLRAFRIAIDYRRMSLAVLAVIVWSAGDILITMQPFFGDRTYRAIETEWDADPRWPWHPYSLEAAGARRSRVALSEALEFPGRSLRDALGSGEAVLWPWDRVFQTARMLIVRQLSWTERLHVALMLAWALLVSGVFGGAISRMAAVEFTGHGDGAVRPAVRFSVKRLVSLFGAPLIPLAGLLVFWFPNFLAGLVAEIPWIGGILVGIFWGLFVLCGVMLALIAVGVCASWPLMVAAVSTDSSDAFDALSRAYSYLFNRPWYALFLTVFAMLYGSALLYFVTGMTTLTVDLTVVSVESGLGPVGNEGLFRNSPNHPLLVPWATFTEALDSPLSETAGTLIGLWMMVVLSVPMAFLFNYFWTAATIIYCLLRRREDATPLDELGLEVSTGEAEVPLVGIPAANERERRAESEQTVDDVTATS